MPAKIAPDALEALCQTFKVGKETAQFFGDFYEDKILPRIQSKYLAHLTISIEEMIDEKIREQSKGKLSENNAGENKAGEDPGRKYTIALLSIEKNPQGFSPGKSKAEVIVFRRCAVIYYKPEKDRKKLRIYIAHELGHLLYHYDIFRGTEEVENHANTFAYFAISGKNNFYQEKLKNLNLIYESEKEIIDNIQEEYTIKGEWQKDHGSLKEAEPV